MAEGGLSAKTFKFLKMRHSFTLSMNRRTGILPVSIFSARFKG